MAISRSRRALFCPNDSKNCLINTSWAVTFPTTLVSAFSCETLRAAKPYERSSDISNSRINICVIISFQLIEEAEIYKYFERKLNKLLPVALFHVDSQSQPNYPSYRSAGNSLVWNSLCFGFLSCCLVAAVCNQKRKNPVRQG